VNEDDLHILRIYLDAGATLNGVAYDAVLMARAREMDIAGAAVLRIEEAFGEAVLHGAKARDLAPEQHLIVEMVDSRAKLDALAATLEVAADVGLATIGKIQVVAYGGHRHRTGAAPA
jgi:PII-like signaling protein